MASWPTTPTRTTTTCCVTIRSSRSSPAAPPRPGTGQPAHLVPFRERHRHPFPVAFAGRLDLDQFIASFATPPRHLTFDIDVFDDPTHGQQQLTFFHGYYDQYQYLPRAITCKENDLVVMVALLFGTAAPTLGIEDDLTHLVKRLRAVWPDVQISIRGDSGFADFAGCTRCAKHLGSTSRRPGHERRAQAAKRTAACKRPSQQYEETGQPQRLFTAFWYQARSVVAAPLDGRQSRGPCPGNQSSRRGHQSPRGDRCCRKPPTTNTPSAARVKTATRNSSAGWQADRLSDHRYIAKVLEGKELRRKDEGSRIKRGQGAGGSRMGRAKPQACRHAAFILHPSSFILHPSSFILHPSSFILTVQVPRTAAGPGASPGRRGGESGRW